MAYKNNDMMKYVTAERLEKGWWAVMYFDTYIGNIEISAKGFLAFDEFSKISGQHVATFAQAANEIMMERRADWAQENTDEIRAAEKAEQQGY